MAVAITQTANPAGAGSGTTITYSGVSIGTAAHDRVVVVCCGTELTSGTPSSATIDYGGGAVAMNASTLGTTGAMGAIVFWRHVPTGATADIAVTFGATQGSTTQHIAVYSCTGAQGTAASSNGVGDTDADPISSGAITIPANGGCVAVASFAADTTARTWTGITEDLDEDAGTFRFTTGTSTTGGTPTITVSGGNNEDGALAWVVFNSSTSVERLPPQGNLALSATAPTVSLTENVAVSPAQANLVLSVAAPTVAIDETSRNIEPPQGNLVLSATAPTAVVSDNQVALPAQGDLTLSITAPTVALTEHVSVSPAAVDLVLSAAAPTVALTDHRDISPAAGQLALSTAAPSAVVDVRLDPASADLILSSAAPSVVQDLRQDPAARDLVLSTTAPTVAWTDNHFRGPAAGNLVLSTAAPTVDATAHHSVSPASADLVLAAFAPQLGGAQDIQPDVGNLALTATAPTVSQDIRLSPASANLVLSGHAPVPSVDVRRDPAAADLVLTGSAPTVSIGGAGDIVISPNTAQMLLTGFAPAVTVGEFIFPPMEVIASVSVRNARNASVAVRRPTVTATARATQGVRE